MPASRDQRQAVENIAMQFDEKTNLLRLADVIEDFQGQGKR